MASRNDWRFSCSTAEWTALSSTPPTLGEIRASPPAFRHRFWENFGNLAQPDEHLTNIIGVPKGIRTPVTAVKERGMTSSQSY